MSERIQAPVLSPPALPAPKPAPAQPIEKNPFGEVFRKLGERIDRGEALLDRTTRSPDLGSLDAGKLIALQAGIYRYVEAVDLTAKLVDRAGNAVKTVLQGNH